jgi:hypothetical protein
VEPLTPFVYGKANAHELLLSSLAGRGLGAAFTFKTFTANLLGLWSWTLRTQGKEGTHDVEGPAEGRGVPECVGEGCRAGVSCSPRPLLTTDNLVR